jgi:hypothetical protein
MMTSVHLTPMVQCPNIICAYSCCCKKHTAKAADKENASSFFSLSAALGLIDLFLKEDGWCPDMLWTHVVHILGLYWTLGAHYKPRKHIRGPKAFMSSTKMCLGSGHNQTCHEWENGQSRKKRSRQYLCTANNNNYVHI